VSATVDYIIQYKSQIPELAKGDAEEYLRAALAELRNIQSDNMVVDTEPASDDNTMDD